MIKKPSKLLDIEISEIINLLSELKKRPPKNFDILCKKSQDSIKNGNKIIFFGNGGSASDAQHLAAELVCKYKKIRKAIPAISLATDTSILTSIGNDMDFKFIFSRQIEAIGKRGDIAIAITTSGNSNNLIEAMKVAKTKGILTFCFSGNDGGRLKKYVNYPVLIPSKTTSQIQVAEILLGQVYCEFLESNCS